MNKTLKSYRALRETKSFKAGLVKVGVAALVGVGGMALFFGAISGFAWIISLPETHPIARLISATVLPTLVLTMIGTVTFIAYILLFSLPGKGSQEG